MRRAALVATVIALAGCGSPEPLAVEPPGATPVADLSAPVLAVAGQLVVLSAEAASDADGDTLVFSFDFGDGTPTVSGPERQVAHRFGAPGLYEVRVVVSDPAGHVAQAAQVVTVVESLDLPQCAQPRDCAWGDACRAGLCYFTGGEIIDE